MDEAVKTRIDWRDCIAVFFCFVALLGECLWLTHGRQAWSDEIFGWELVRDPSIRHMIAAWRLGADGGGILFYLVVRAWAAVFGSSIVALRLCNACAFGDALAILWVTARRWYRFEIVAFSLPFLWFTAHSVLRELMVGRFYGLLTTSVALGVLCFAVTADKAKTSPPILLAIFWVHTLLVGMHPFGLLYSAAVILGTVAYDIRLRRLRVQLYLSALSGWWILFPSWAAMRASAAVGKPHFWTTTPHPGDLMDAIGFWTDEIQALAFFLLFCLIVRWIWMRKKHSRLSYPDAPAIIIGWAILLIVPLLWLISLHGTSYFVDRYLVPVVIGAALLLCATLQRLVPARRSLTLSCALAVAMAVVGAGTVYGAIWDMPSFFTIPPHRYTSTIATLLPHGKPIVVERVDIFAEAVSSESQLRLLYLLDWGTVLLPSSPLGDVSGYHEMQNWRRAGYHAGNIQDSGHFLSEQTEFFVVADPSEPWFPRHIQFNPAYVSELVGRFQRDHDTEEIWHVMRRNPKP